MYTYKYYAVEINGTRQSQYNEHLFYMEVRIVGCQTKGCHDSF